MPLQYKIIQYFSLGELVVHAYTSQGTRTSCLFLSVVKCKVMQSAHFVCQTLTTPKRSLTSHHNHSPSVFWKYGPNSCLLGNWALKKKQEKLIPQVFIQFNLLFKTHYQTTHHLGNNSMNHYVIKILYRKTARRSRLVNQFCGRFSLAEGFRQRRRHINLHCLKNLHGFIYFCLLLVPSWPLAFKRGVVTKINDYEEKESSY